METPSRCERSCPSNRHRHSLNKMVSTHPRQQKQLRMHHLYQRFLLSVGPSCQGLHPIPMHSVSTVRCCMDWDSVRGPWPWGLPRCASAHSLQVTVRSLQSWSTCPRADCDRRQWVDTQAHQSPRGCLAASTWRLVIDMALDRSISEVGTLHLFLLLTLMRVCPCISVSSFPLCSTLAVT